MGGGPDELPDMYEEVQPVNHEVDPNTVLLYGPWIKLFQQLRLFARGKVIRQKVPDILIDTPGTDAFRRSCWCCQRNYRC